MKLSLREKLIRDCALGRFGDAQRIGAGRQFERSMANVWRALCPGPQGGFAYITQYGWELNLVNEVGLPSRAWIDYPGHIWVDRANEGAIYSPDGFTLQFDRGTVWQRAPIAPPPPLRNRG